MIRHQFDTISSQTTFKNQVFTHKNKRGQLLQAGLVQLSYQNTLYIRLFEASHSLSLPYRGAGIYLYTVKSGSRELVLKGYSVGGVSSGNAAKSQGSSNAANVIKATIDALSKLRDPRTVAQDRTKLLSKVFNG